MSSLNDFQEGPVVVLTSIGLGHGSYGLPALDQETQTNKAKLLSFGLAMPVKSANDFGQILIRDMYAHSRSMQNLRPAQAICKASLTRLFHVEEESTHYEDASTRSNW